jgi:hypothetical protein
MRSSSAFDERSIALASKIGDAANEAELLRRPSATAPSMHAVEKRSATSSLEYSGYKQRIVVELVAHLAIAVRRRGGPTARNETHRVLRRSFATSSRDSDPRTASPLHPRTRHVVLAMITTTSHTKWPGDVAIRDLTQYGLPVPSLV